LQVGQLGGADATRFHLAEDGHRIAAVHQTIHIQVAPQAPQRQVLNVSIEPVRRRDRRPEVAPPNFIVGKVNDAVSVSVRPVIRRNELADRLAPENVV
jgi:hypothetical protein